MNTIDLTRAPLVDGFNRSIDYLRVSVTDKCNLRCVYCMPEGGLAWLRRDEILSYEEIVAIVEAAASVGVRAIRLTGGEPLLRRDLARLVGAIARVDGIEDVALSTNALLLEAQLPELAAGGLRRVNVSLDTLRPDRFEAIARRPGLDLVPGHRRRDRPGRTAPGPLRPRAAAGEARPVRLQGLVRAVRLDDRRVARHPDPHVHRPR